MVNFIEDKMKRLDIFGQPIKLQINGEEELRSLLGGFMTIFLFVLVAISLVIYSKDCLFKMNPQISTTTEYKDTILFLNQTNFSFRINTVNKTQTDLTPYFKLESFGKNISNCYSSDNNITTSPLYNGTFFSDNYYCVFFENSTDLVDSDRFDVFDIFFCTNDQICKDKNEIKNFVTNDVNNIEYTIDSQTMDLHAYKNPISQITFGFETFLYPNAKILNTVGLTAHVMITDDGFIYSNTYSNNNSSLQIIKADEFQEEIAYPHYCETDNIFDDFYCNKILEINLQTYSKVITYKRTYKRIADTLANVGGISSVVITVFSLITNFYCAFIRDERIANYIYDFHFDETKYRDKIIMSNKHDKISELLSNFKNSKIKSNEKDCCCKELKITLGKANENIEEKMNFYFYALPDCSQSETSKEKVMKTKINLISLEKINQKRNKKQFKFKLYHHIIYYLFCHCNKKNSFLKTRYEYYQKVQNEIKSILDIKRILYRIEDHENLKMIILNNEQFALLNYITKYNFRENIEGHNNKYNLDKNFLKKEENLLILVNELLTKIKNISHSFNIDPITLKLLEYLDRNLIEE